MSPVARSWRAGFPAKLGPLGISHQLDGAGKSGQRECNSDAFIALSTDHPLTVHCSAAEPGGPMLRLGAGSCEAFMPPPMVLILSISGLPAPSNTLLLFLRLRFFSASFRPLPTIHHRHRHRPCRPSLSSTLQLCCRPCKAEAAFVKNPRKYGLLSSAMGSQAALWYVVSSMP